MRMSSVILFHSTLHISSGAGSLILALGGVEIVSDGELQPLGVHAVGLLYDMASAVGHHIVSAETGEVVEEK